MGVREPVAGASETLWIVFDVQSGAGSDVVGVLSDGDAIPEDVHAAKPDIVAVATLHTWSLAKTNPHLFATAAEKGRLHIDGDFRTFGRSFPALLRLVTATTFWEEVDHVVAQLA